MSKLIELVSDYSLSEDQANAVDKLSSGLQSGNLKQTLLGVTGSGKTFTVANVIAKVQKPTMILAPNKTLAAQLYSEMKGFFPNNAVEYFVSYYDYYQPEAYVPSSDLFIEKDSSINEHIEQMRLSATKSLLERRDVILVASVSAIYGLGDPDLYLKMLLHVKVGDKAPMQDMLIRLTELQYKRNDVDFSRGAFRSRGEVLDIFPADSEKEAVRIELFDSEVERISWFDPLTGKSIKSINRISIYPKTHYATPKSQVVNMSDSIKAELKERQAYFRNHNKLIEEQRITERVRYDLEMMQELGYCSGIENYSRYLSNREAGKPPSTLIDYLPKDALLVIDESHVTIPQVGAMYKGDFARKSNLVDYGFRLPSALDNRPLKFDEFEDIMPQTIFVSATPGLYEAEHSETVVEQIIRPTGLLDPIIDIKPVATQVDDLLSEINQCLANKSRALVITLTKKMSESLTDYLLEHNIKTKYIHSDIDTVERVDILRDLRLGKFDVLVGVNLLREGLDLPEVSLVAVMDADKEGFLRSHRSLVQIIGRAARHVNGRAIFYADNITGSIQKTMQETSRRRKLQSDYNKKHNISPKTVVREIADLSEETDLVDNDQDFGSKYKYINKNPKKINKAIKELSKKMHDYAEKLEFEAAVVIRDEVDYLKQLLKK